MDYWPTISTCVFKFLFITITGVIFQPEDGTSSVLAFKKGLFDVHLNDLLCLFYSVR